jgi:type I restriction enzyme S subunit
MSAWLSELPPTWRVANPRRHFRDRREVARSDDVHLTPSQHMGVLTQTDYMERTGSRVVLNLSAPDNMKHVEPGDFIAHLRSFQGGIEHSGLRGKVSTAYTVIAPHDSVHGAFYRWVLKSAAFISELSARLEQLRDGQSVKFEDLAAIPLPLPPMSEQRRIADFLDERVARIDQIIAAREDQIAHLDALARSSLATSLLVQAEETIALRYLIEDERLGIWGDEPGQSEVDVSVARVADFVRSDFRLGEAPTVRSVTKSQLGVRVLRHGDVLLERSGGTQVNPVGCPAFVESPTSLTVSSNFVSRLRPTAATDGRYLSLVLGALYSTRQQAPHATQTTGIQNLDTGSYFSMRVPQETLRAQRTAAARADATLSTTRRYQQELRLAVSSLGEYKQSLITAAVTGELDVTTAGSGIPNPH